MGLPRTIIEKLDEEGYRLSEEDLPEPDDDSEIQQSWVVDQLMQFYAAKIIELAQYAYKTTGSQSIAVQAFREWSRKTLHRGAHTFIFRSQHWRSGRKIGPYLITCLTRLAKGIRTDVESSKKINVPVCPACRFYREKEFLAYENRLLRCQQCTSALERELNNNEDRLRKIFALHSRKGYRCPDCRRFFPDTYVRQSYGVSCPYNDCGWFGTANELEMMSHPLGMSTEAMTSLNTVIMPPSGYPDSELQDFIPINEAGADLQMEVNQRCCEELVVLESVIEAQLNHIEKMLRPRYIKKQLMYRAFYNMLKCYPEEMVSYLVHMKHAGELPIQSRIFQEFIRLVENELPFLLNRNGKEVEVESLLDSNLDLFLGISEFEAVVDEQGYIPNHTVETYVGSRKLRDFGPCFIGLLTGLEGVQGESLYDLVEYYSFSQIKLRDAPSGLPVKVTHYRIPSHYEMNGLVPLQRVRRRIVDSVYQRLHGHRRPVKGRVDEIRT